MKDIEYRKTHAEYAVISQSFVGKQINCSVLRIPNFNFITSQFLFMFIFFCMFFNDYMKRKKRS